MTKGEQSNLLGFALVGIAIICPPFALVLLAYVFWYVNKGGITGIDSENEMSKRNPKPKRKEWNPHDWRGKRK